MQCCWPSGEIRWRDDSWLVEMPVKIEVLDSNNKSIVTHNTVSQEYLFAADELKRMAEHLGVYSAALAPSNITGNSFKQSNLMILRKIR